MGVAGRTRMVMLLHPMMVCVSVISHFTGMRARTFLVQMVWKKGRTTKGNPNLAMVAVSVTFKRVYVTVTVASLAQLVRLCAQTNVEDMVNVFQIWLAQLYVIVSLVGVA